MVSNNDKLWIGLLAGLVIPFLGYFLALQANGWIASAIDRPFAFKESTVALIGICLNMLPLGYFRRRMLGRALQGTLVITMVLAIAWFVKYGTGIL